MEILRDYNLNISIFLYLFLPLQYFNIFILLQVVKPSPDIHEHFYMIRELGVHAPSVLA